MRLTFLGTRGEIEVRSHLHRRHSALLVQTRKARIMVDCGGDWLGRLATLAPTAIVLTHGHPDHAAGLAKGASCPVFATRATWALLRHYPIRDRRVMPLRRSVTIDGVKFKAFPVRHSIRAPAVGYRVSENGGTVFYVPDVAQLPNARLTLRGIDAYIGDGATIERSMVRKRQGTLIGHAPVMVQLGWCAAAHVPRAIFTHCGSPIVASQGRAPEVRVQRLGQDYGVEAELAHDGDRLLFRRAGRGARKPNPSWRKINCRKQALKQM